MDSKTYLVVFAQALLIQAISAQCIGAPYETLAPWGAPYAAGPWAATAVEYPGYAPYSLAASNGGGFAVSSVSPIAPNGVRVTSENVYEGPVLVTGQLPFLSAVALEGALPSTGIGAISYGCGNGNVAILSEDIAPAPIGPYGYGPVAGPAIGYNGAPIGYGVPNFGCGAIF